MSIEVNILPNINTIIKHKKKALPVSNHPHLPPFYFIYTSIAQKNSGKTYSVCNFIKLYEEHGIKSGIGEEMPIKTIWCSPTSNFSTNSIIYTLKSLDEDDVYDQVSERTLIEIFEKIKAEKELIKKKDIYISAYKRFIKIKDPNRLSIEDILILGEYNFEPPNVVFGNLKDYMYFWVLDDVIGGTDSVIGSKKNNFLNNLAIKSRHYQVNLIIISQKLTYLPPIIRNQVDILQLFPSASIKVLESYYDEVSNTLTWEEFLELFAFATKEKYSSLIINNHPNAPHRFLSNWNRALSVNRKS